MSGNSVFADPPIAISAACGGENPEIRHRRTGSPSLSAPRAVSAATPRPCAIAAGKPDGERMGLKPSEPFCLSKIVFYPGKIVFHLSPVGTTIAR